MLVIKSLCERSKQHAQQQNFNEKYQKFISADFTTRAEERTQVTGWRKGYANRFSLPLPPKLASSFRAKFFKFYAVTFSL